jgi:hypothetical protein
MAGGGGDGAEHRIGMADHIFGAGEHGQVDAVGDGGEQQRRRPGIVHDRHAATRASGGDDGGDVLHLEAEAAGAFHEDGAGTLADQVGDAGADQRIVKPRGDAQALEQAGREAAGRVIGAVDEEQLVAGG